MSMLDDVSQNPFWDPDSEYAIALEVLVDNQILVNTHRIRADGSWECTPDLPNVPWVGQPWEDAAYSCLEGLGVPVDLLPEIFTFEYMGTLEASGGACAAVVRCHGVSEIISDEPRLRVIELPNLSSFSTTDSQGCVFFWAWWHQSLWRTFRGGNNLLAVQEALEVLPPFVRWIPARFFGPHSKDKAKYCVADSLGVLHWHRGNAGLLNIWPTNGNQWLSSEPRLARLGGAAGGGEMSSSAGWTLHGANLGHLTAQPIGKESAAICGFKLPYACWLQPELAQGSSRLVGTLGEALFYTDYPFAPEPEHLEVVGRQIAGPGGPLDVMSHRGGYESHKSLFEEYDIIGMLERDVLDPSLASNESSLFHEQTLPHAQKMLEDLSSEVFGASDTTSIEQSISRLGKLRDCLVSVEKDKDKWRPFCHLAHGILNVGHILVDSTQNVWLMDAGGHCSIQPAGHDLATLIGSILLDGCGVSIARADLQAFASATETSVERVADWLATTESCAAKILSEETFGEDSCAFDDEMARAQMQLCTSKHAAAKEWAEASEVGSLVLNLVHGEALDEDQVQEFQSARQRVCRLCSALISSAAATLKRNISSKTWLVIPLLHYMLRSFSSSQMSPWQRLWALEQASHLGTMLVNLITQPNSRVRRTSKESPNSKRHSFLLHRSLLSPMTESLANVCFASGHHYFVAPKFFLEEPKNISILDDGHSGGAAGEPLLGWPCPACCVPEDWFLDGPLEHDLPECWSDPLAVRIQAARAHAPEAQSPSRLVYGLERINVSDPSLKLEFDPHPLKFSPGHWAKLIHCGQILATAKLSDECQVPISATAHLKQLRAGLKRTFDGSMVLIEDIPEIGVKEGWAVLGHTGDKNVVTDLLIAAALDPRRELPVFDVPVPSRQAFMKILLSLNLHAPFKRNFDNVLLQASTSTRRASTSPRRGSTSPQRRPSKDSSLTSPRRRSGRSDQWELTQDIELEDHWIVRKGWQLISSDPLTEFLKRGRPLDAYGQVEFKSFSEVKQDFELTGGNGHSVFVTNVAADGRLMQSGMTTEAQLTQIGSGRIGQGEVDQFWMRPAERILEGGVLCCVTIDFWEGRRFVGKVQCTGEGSKEFELCSERIEGIFTGEDPASPKPEIQEHVKVRDGPEFLRRCNGRILIRSLNASNRIIATKIVVTKTCCPDADGDYLLTGPSLKRVRYDSRNDFSKDLHICQTEEGIGVVDYVAPCGFAERAGVKVGYQLLNLAGCSENVMALLERGLQASEFPCTAGFINPNDNKYPLYRFSKKDGRNRPAEIRYDLQLKQWQLCVSDRALYTNTSDSIVVPSNRWELNMEEVVYLPKYKFVPGPLRPNEIGEIIGRADGPTPESSVSLKCNNNIQRIKVRAANGRTGWYPADALDIIETKQEMPRPMFWTATRATKEAMLMDGNVMRLELPGIAYPTSLTFRDLSPLNLTFQTNSQPVKLTFSTGDFCRLKIHLENDVIHDPTLQEGELPVEVHFQKVGKASKGTRNTVSTSSDRTSTVLLPHFLSLHVVLHPPGARICVGDWHSGREATVEDMTKNGLYKVRFDGEGEDDIQELPLLRGDHRPAGMFRYAEGQGLMVHAPGFGRNGAAGWTDGKVERIALGNQHCVALNKGTDVRWLDLGLGNHAPGWLSTSSFDVAARRYRNYVLSRHGAVTSVATVWPEDVFLQAASLMEVDRLAQPSSGPGSQRLPEQCSSSPEQTPPESPRSLQSPPDSPGAWSWNSEKYKSEKGRKVRPAPRKLKDLKNFGANTIPKSFHDEAWELLASLVEESPDRWRGLHPNPCFVVFGGVSSGKTRLASWLAALCVRVRTDLVPILVPVCKLANMMHRGALGWDLLRSYLNKTHGEGSERELFLRQAIYARRALLIFDGLSEAGRHHRQIEHYICSLAGARHRVLCTARPGVCNMDKLEDAGLILLELGPLKQQQQDFMARQHLDPCQLEPFREVLDEQQDISSNPLIFRLFLSFAEASTNIRPSACRRFEIFDSSISVWCSRAEQREALHSTPARGDGTPLQLLLEFLAHTLRHKQVQVFSGKDIENITSKEPALQQTWKDVLKKCLVEDSFPLITHASIDPLAAGQDQFQFAHPCVEEFLVARHAMRSWQAGHDCLSGFPPVEQLLFLEEWSGTLRFLFESPVQVSLNLRGTQLSQDFMYRLSDCLRKSTGIAKLHLGNCSLGDDGLVILAGVLRSNYTLKSLDLRQNGITVAGVDLLAKSLPLGGALHNLSLRDNYVTADGVAILAEALKDTLVLKCLDLKGCHIQDIGSLATLLGTSACPQLLNIASNRVQQGSMEVFTKALCTAKNLRHLRLNHNPISDEAVGLIADAIRVNYTLLRLDLCSCGTVAVASAKHLADVLADSNCKLRILSLRGNLVEDDGASHIAKSLRVNVGLERLDLRQNGIGDIGAKSLAAALEENSTLRQLQLGSNLLTEACLKELAHSSVSMGMLSGSSRLDCGENSANPQADAVQQQGNHSDEEEGTGLGMSFEAKFLGRSRRNSGASSTLDDFDQDVQLLSEELRLPGLGSCQRLPERIRKNPPGQLQGYGPSALGRSIGLPQQLASGANDNFRDWALRTARPPPFMAPWLENPQIVQMKFDEVSKPTTSIGGESPRTQCGSKVSPLVGRLVLEWGACGAAGRVVPRRCQTPV